jgi:hypothetical protein
MRFRPGFGAEAGEGAVGGEVEVDAMLDTEVEDVFEVWVEQWLSHRGRDDLAEAVGHGVGDGAADEVDGHEAAGAAFSLAGGLQRAVGGVLFAHDAAEVAGVGVGVEGDPPGSGGGVEAGAVTAADEGVIDVSMASVWAAIAGMSPLSSKR